MFYILELFLKFLISNLKLNLESNLEFSFYKTKIFPKGLNKFPKLGKLFISIIIISPIVFINCVIVLNYVKSINYIKIINLIIINYSILFQGFQDNIRSTITNSS